MLTASTMLVITLLRWFRRWRNRVGAVRAVREASQMPPK